VLIQVKNSIWKLMDDIIEPNSTFDFTKLSLGQPAAIQGGAYFTKILYNSKPLYIQTPKSSTKQGFIKNAKKIYCDLMFDTNDEEFITWMENLESTCHSLIFEKSEAWFQNSLELNDVESAFNSILKSYKSGKKYLVRTNVKVNSVSGSPIIKIYNESEMPLTIDDVNSETSVISILEVQGIKFTTRNFQIEIELKQTMMLNTDKIFENCLIKKKPTKQEEVSMLAIERTQTENASNVVLSEIILQDMENSQHVQDVANEENNTKENIVNEKNVHNIEENNDKEENTYQREQQNDGENKDIIVDLDENTENLEIVPIEFSFDKENLETITLKKPNQVYYELYKEAREKAKRAKKEAVLAYLEAKNIKKAYMLEDIDSSDDSDVENIESESDEE
jgi:hypothetical protein